ncbi:hypothetical protein BD410DRAFT_783189 [Rickenella mellea]|uniref:F-box domain-containing protein n=1 Tax=Rickenella mellea TaxID=50990 RepID=A0A4Y7QJM8_9AGAM|nr:hypothetical protein BD410DRAFT_783189 [Rickenella mellea]
MAITRLRSGKLSTPTRKPKEPLLPLGHDSLADAVNASLPDTKNTNQVGKKRIRIDVGMDGDARSSVKKKTAKKASKSSKTAKGMKFGCLAVLPSMPLDILYEIFGHLRPIDLLQLTRANKALNNILMAESAKSVWKATRSNIPTFPDTPGDKSDAEWVHLVFETNCHGPGCKKRNVRKIDWAFRIRACERCWKKNLVLSTRFTQQYPDLEPEIMQLLPYSNTSDWTYGFKSNNRFYWGPAILALAETLDEYDKNVELRKPGAEAALLAFKEEQAAHAATTIKSTSVCAAWESDEANKLQAELQKLTDKRLHEIKARFVNLGWSPEHLWSLQYHALTRQSKELTEKAWVSIRPELEKYLQEKRYRRRRDGVYYLINDYFMTRVGTHLFIRDIFDNGDLEDIIKADGTHDLTSHELDRCRTLGAILVEEILERAKRRVLAVLPSSVNEVGGILDRPRIECATSALTCLNPSFSGCQSGSIIYWPDTVTHPNDSAHQLVYDPTLSSIIQSVVQAIGLSPDVATPAQLDASGAKLKCTTIEPCTAMRTMRWRDAVKHCRNYHEPSWYLVDKKVP